MKNIKNKFMAVLGLSALLSLDAVATPIGIGTATTAFSAGTTNGASTRSWAVVSARSGNGGAPAINYINAGSATNDAIYFYKVIAKATVLFTNSTVTLFVDNTNGFVLTDTYLIQHRASDTYEKRTGTASGQTAATNLVVTAATQGAVIPGDIVYDLTLTGQPTLAWNAVTNGVSSGAGFLFIGQAGLPLLVEIPSLTTATAYMNDVTGVYLPPVRPGSTP